MSISLMPPRLNYRNSCWTEHIPSVCMCAHSCAFKLACLLLMWPEFHEFSASACCIICVAGAFARFFPIFYDISSWLLVQRYSLDFHSTVDRSLKYLYKSQMLFCLRIQNLHLNGTPSRLLADVNSSIWCDSCTKIRKISSFFFLLCVCKKR